MGATPLIWGSCKLRQAKQLTRTGRAGAVTKEGSDATLHQHVSPIEWGNVILYGQYVLDRAHGKRYSVSQVAFGLEYGRYEQ